MSSDEYVFDRLSDAGVPVAHGTWGPAKCRPALPYAVFRELEHSCFADNGNYGAIPRYRATLYARDEGAVEAFKSAVASLGSYVAHAGHYDDEHHAYVHDFDITLVRRDA